MAYTIEDLRAAERHIALGEYHIARQRQLIERFAADPNMLSIAERLLAELQATQADHLDHRDRILSDLKHE
jgi:hypothetical protein